MTGLLEATRALTGKQLRGLDRHLRQRFGVTLDQLQTRRLRQLAGLRERGRLSSDEQHRLVVDRIDEIADDPQRIDELSQLMTLRDSYEALIDQRLARKRARGERAS